VFYCLQLIWNKIVLDLINKFKHKSKPVTPLSEIAEKEKSNHDYLKYNQKYIQSLDVSFLVKNQLDISTF